MNILFFMLNMHYHLKICIFLLFSLWYYYNSNIIISTLSVISPIYAKVKRVQYALFFFTVSIPPYKCIYVPFLWLICLSFYYVSYCFYLNMFLMSSFFTEIVKYGYKLTSLSCSFSVTANIGNSSFDD